MGALRAGAADVDVTPPGLLGRGRPGAEDDEGLGPDPSSGDEPLAVPEGAGVEEGRRAGMAVGVGDLRTEALVGGDPDEGGRPRPVGVGVDAGGQGLGTPALPGTRARRPPSGRPGRPELLGQVGTVEVPRGPEEDADVIDFR